MNTLNNNCLVQWFSTTSLGTTNAPQPFVKCSTQKINLRLKSELFFKISVECPSRKTSQPSTHYQLFGNNNIRSIHFLGSKMLFKTIQNKECTSNTRQSQKECQKSCH